jgi:hypothetical protein
LKSSELSEISSTQWQIIKEKRDSYFAAERRAQRKVHRDFHADYHSGGSAVVVPLEEYEILHLLL